VHEKTKYQHTCFLNSNSFIFEARDDLRYVLCNSLETGFALLGENKILFRKIIFIIVAKNDSKCNLKYFSMKY